VEVVEPELEGGRLALAAHGGLELGLHLLDDLLDARRVDAAVGDEALDRLLGDLAAVRVEAREDDGARRVVDDQVDAGGDLERADVAALAADDAALQSSLGRSTTETVVSMRVLGGAALDGLGDDLLGLAAASRGPRPRGA
jgi:hypothetical protein